MNFDFADYVRDVADFPRPGIVFKDLTPLLGRLVTGSRDFH